MKRSMRFFLMVALVVLAVLGVGSVAMAEPICNDKEIIFATGDTKGTYSMMFQTIEKMAPQLVCEYTDTTGGFVNVNLLLERKIDAGIVQTDVMEFMKRTDARVEKKLRSLGSLHGNMIHIIVNRNGFPVKQESGFGKLFSSTKMVMISNLRDLKKLPVVAFGSGFITARMIDERLNLDFTEVIEVEKKEDGLKMVQNGEAAAMIAMGGVPISWVEKLDRNTFALANVELSDIGLLGRPYYVSKMNYRTLGIMGANAITVRNEIIVWDYNGERGQRLDELRSFLRDHLEDIKEERGSHPAWQDVDTLDDGLWIKYTSKLNNKKK